MYSQLKSSFSFMGISNSEMLLSEKDLNSMEFNFLVRPPLEFEGDDGHDQCDSSPSEAGPDDDDDEEDKEEQAQVQELQELENEEESSNKCKLLVSSLRVKLPSLEEFKIQQEENQDFDDGFKTPTSLDTKIPFILPCPPAPRKPKSLPSKKRKLPSRRRVLLDLSNEIESLFPPSLRADLGKKIKKVRQENSTN